MNILQRVYVLIGYFNDAPRDDDEGASQALESLEALVEHGGCLAIVARAHDQIEGLVEAIDF